MLEKLSQVEADLLGLDAYLEDFWAHWDKVEDVFWKLERGQTFRELGDASWEAMVEGRWDEALEILETRHQPDHEYYQQVAALGFETRRIRIVELPVTPYLQWELNSFRIRTGTGERIRVLDAAKLGDLETAGHLPELTILGTRVMYEVRYDDNGTPNGARKVENWDVIDACRVELEPLYAQAEDFRSFFEREIAKLPPPFPGPAPP